MPTSDASLFFSPAERTRQGLLLTPPPIPEPSPKRFSDDNGATWKVVPDSPGASNVTGDANSIFVSRNAGYQFASLSDVTKWTKMSAPPFREPDNVKAWRLVYDADHHLLYSVNSTAGAWRVRTE